ncbi:hypothetical protein LIER_15229 [Lithospermum erythrorhizon]|uniref:Uncharacterized protein n=1 Tax=Lithospermum erythrorhizon TaxID=34254 RepID=A0AAV3Q3K3_LITER
MSAVGSVSTEAAKASASSSISGSPTILEALLDLEGMESHLPSRPGVSTRAQSALGGAEDRGKIISHD